MFETVRLREGREVRKLMPAVHVAEGELTLHAKHQIAGLEVAASLTAADEAAVLLTAVVRKHGTNCVALHQRRIDPVPSASDIAADIAARPGRHRREYRLGLERHV